MRQVKMLECVCWSACTGGLLWGRPRPAAGMAAAAAADWSLALALALAAPAPAEACEVRSGLDPSCQYQQP